MNEQQASNNDVVISIKNVSKKFCKNLKRSMAYGIVDLSKNLLGIKPNSTGLRKDEFWAVNDVSFELRRGEVLGLIGVNGSGKTTLLRLLSGIFPPDEGEISIKGRVGALIAVGAGFHPHMTGRENIYLNGTILGMSHEEINSKFQDIVDFAEIGDFLDAPVSTYSSGMRVRLGFSIAAHTRPDVMLIDEILAVGDVGFKAKCYNAIADICSNSAVILVSHAMPQIGRISTKICLLDQGKAVYIDNDIAKGIEKYYTSFKKNKSVITGNHKAEIHDITLESGGKKHLNEIEYLDDLTIHLHISVKSTVESFVVNISFLNKELQIIAQCNSLYNRKYLLNPNKSTNLKIDFPSLSFNPGTYSISVSIMDQSLRQVLIQHYAIKEIRIKGHFIGLAPVQLMSDWKISY